MSETETLLDYQEFLARLLEEITPLAPRELPVGDTLGLTLAEPIISRLAVPPFTNSAMDGFAFNSACLLYTSPSPRDS